MKPLELDALSLHKLLNTKPEQHVVLSDLKLGAFMTMEEYEKKWGINQVTDTTDEVNGKTTG